MKSYKEEKTYEENKALGTIKKNTKYFYKYEWRFSQVKLKIGPLLNNQGELLNDSLAMANILVEQSAKMFSEPNNNSRQVTANESVSINDISFSEKDIINAIAELKK